VKRNFNFMNGTSWSSNSSLVAFIAEGLNSGKLKARGLHLEPPQNLLVDGGKPILSYVELDGRNNLRPIRLRTDVRFEGISAVTISNTVLWIVRPCSSETARRFGGIPTLHHQG
jgi:hypothetical protein